MKIRKVPRHAPLKKEHGIWVYQGETTDASIIDLLDREREKRLSEFVSTR
jgi:hypothetical protein